MSYIQYNPKSNFDRAMFDFQLLPNFIFSGTVNVSVSDGFSNIDYSLGLINNTDLTLYPYSNEILWSQADKSNISNTLGLISSFANIKFSNLIDYDVSGGGLFSIASPADVGNLSDINICLMNANSTLLSGESSLNLDSMFGYIGAKGDVFINITGSDFVMEGLTFADYTRSRQVLIHEIFHSLGLSHPFDNNYNIKSNYASLMSTGFDQLGFRVTAASDINKEYFSIMSYDDQSSEGLNNAFTPMIFDVIALQIAYGEGSGTSGSGNDTIPAGNIGYRTYFDVGGNDTVSLTSYASGVYFNMGVNITGASHLVGVAMSLNDAFTSLVNGGDPAALRWFYGEYENAVGSTASDLIIGNSLSNNIDSGDGDDTVTGGEGDDTLKGGAGNDTLKGGAGNDLISGGDGSDTAIFSDELSSYSIKWSSESQTFAVTSLGDGTDKLSSVEFLKFSNVTLQASLLTSDTVAPKVSTFSPADETTAVPIGANIVVTFSEAVQRGLGSIILKTAAGAVVATYDAASSTNLSISGSTLTINPTADLGYSTGYKVEFAAGTIKDIAGNSYAGVSDYNFTTAAAPDTTAPTVTTFSPADETTAVPIGSNIVLTFSEAVQRGSGNIVLKTAAGAVLATYDAASSANLSISGSTLTINPTADLGYSTGYKVEFAAGTIKDIAGNSYAGVSDYNFTTAAAPDTIAPGVKITRSWTYSNATMAGELVQDAELDAANNILFTGYENNDTGSKGFIQKLGSDGKVQWTTPINIASGNDRSISLAITPSNQILVGGHIYSNDSQSSLDYVHSSGTAYIAAIDAGGNILNINKNIVGSLYPTSAVIPDHIEASVDGNLLIAGEFYTSSYNGVYLASLDKSQQQLWRINLDTIGLPNSGAVINDLDLDDNGNGLITVSIGNGDHTVLAKFDKIGNLLWEHSDTPGKFIWNQYNQSAISPDGSIYYVASEIVDAIKKLDNTVQKLSSNGDLIWEKHFGTTNNDRVVDITTDKAGNVIILSADGEGYSNPGYLTIFNPGGEVIASQEVSRASDSWTLYEKILVSNNNDGRIQARSATRDND